MKFQLSPKLIEYMKQREHDIIHIRARYCGICGGPFYDISAHFVDSQKAEQLKSGGHLSFPHDFGEVLIRHVPTKADEVVQLGLAPNEKYITVEGIHEV